jgi:hypothetical protein
VRYEVSGAPVIQGNCHCRQCQKTTGSAYSATLFFPVHSLKVSGETKAFTGAGESRTTTIIFCPKCGTQLLTRPVTMSQLVGVRAGTLDDPDLYEPAADIFVKSAAAWDHMDPAIPKFDAYPPMG